MTLNLQEVARAVGAAAHPPPLAVAGWSVDTRTQNPGDVYFALRGPNHDGHNFLTAAVEKGAAAVVVERSGGMEELPGASELRSDWQAEACPTLQLLVPDTGRALQNLAAWARQKWGGRIVAVAGSAGKTTTKDANAHLLETALPTGKTSGNFNNHVGVPLSLLRLPDACRAADRKSVV
jgi:UDP-N-acetylmuramoyl-tripeptide--D-alanyl-D-alanine ligase